jgi:hypothetical protein
MRRLLLLLLLLWLLGWLCSSCRRHRRRRLHSKKLDQANKQRQEDAATKQEKSPASLPGPLHGRSRPWCTRSFAHHLPSLLTINEYGACMQVYLCASLSLSLSLLFLCF